MDVNVNKMTNDFFFMFQRIYFENEWRRKHKNLVKSEYRRKKIRDIFNDFINKNQILNNGAQL